MAYCRCEEDTEVFAADFLPEFTQVNHAVHHLCDAKAMSKVMEWIIPVILLNAKLQNINAMTQ